MEASEVSDVEAFILLFLSPKDEFELEVSPPLICGSGEVACVLSLAVTVLERNEAGDVRPLLPGAFCDPPPKLGASSSLFNEASLVGKFRDCC